ncbi:hypothetical protein BK120_08165 [Paenibacillus sp. FSL A5-0031]|uniref:hypothetical protein n=1 Tax=Paenibacillus sp. FSL A5-0031 TaxID=1920420 RepID=UPI00096F4947|nr:hypothetical protein [Paenibacillus sp. FSL A5-0031]OME86888.1 hypothetical protein BK120_08165 [Paenibacillus sp. FSL A5-0031]
MKYKGFRQLTAPLHFYTAALDESVVLAFQNNELIGTGLIDEITNETVKIRDEQFMRANCTFVYAK